MGTLELDMLFAVIGQYEEFNFTLWNLYIAVATALLGYSIGSTRLRRLPPRLILLAGFLAFAWGNANYLHRNQILINGLAAQVAIHPQLPQSLGNDGFIARWSESQPKSLYWMHFAADTVIVLLVLFGPSLVAKRKEKHVADA